MGKLKVGDKAPHFKMEDHTGKMIDLNDYAGKKLILFFYPKDMTPGCTAESCNLRDYYSELQEKGFEVVGVSMDSNKRHVKFADKYELPYPLLPDEDKEIIEAYGVWALKKFMGKEYMGIVRTTFVIDEKGNIERIFDKVKTKAHAEQILEDYQN